MHDEPRYTPDEMFDKYFEFLKDEQERLTKRGIRTWEHEELLLRFFAYVKNTTFITVKKASEEKKMREEMQRFEAWVEQRKRERERQEQEAQALVQETKQLQDKMFGEREDGTLFKP